jgi:methylenetetrahydrofolate dehydrogenase (NADP+) / methenyltetrahydrofolate cyclohydrolase
MYKLIDGTAISLEIKNEVKASVVNLKANNIIPTLAVVLVGRDKASQTYVKNKEKACDYVGIKYITHILDNDTSEWELLNFIETLNNDNEINAILVQLPLPKHINVHKVLVAITPEKDVDGFHPYNVGLLNAGIKTLNPCTPVGIIELLKRSNVTIESSNCVVIGRSSVVGKPMLQLLLQENATVTICHSKTKNLKEICITADILVVAIGKAKFLSADMIKENAVVIDVGINRLDDGTICGDVDFEAIKEKVDYITPVPGGVGPMTIAILLRNCVEACENQLALFEK